MKAITLHQPWAQLIALGVKTIETRGWGTTHRGRIAIHAGMKAAPYPLDLSPGVFTVGARGVPSALYVDDGGAPMRCTHAMHLGAIVATANLIDCVPIVDYKAPTPRSGPLDSLNVPACLDVHGGTLTYWWHHDGGFRDVTDQWHYGDFRPGWWAWLLDDIEPTTERCPACWGEEEVRCVVHSAMDEACAICWIGQPCPTCEGDGSCPPIPAKGKRGVWEWTP